MHFDLPFPSLDAQRASAPAARFLSNGRYRVLLTAAGTGFSAFENQALTRWSCDRVEDRDGFFIYIRDRENGAFWSAGLQPTLRAPALYGAAWRPGAFEIARSDDGIETRMEICIPSGTQMEIRRVVLSNASGRDRVIEVTSYIEVVLHDRIAHESHPAFSKLFLQTAFVAERNMLLVTRRARAAGETHPCLFHTLLGVDDLEYETDRARFLGRCRDANRPIALESAAPLSRTRGNVLDPALCLRGTVALREGETSQVAFVLGAAGDEADATAMLANLSGQDGWEAAFVSAQRTARGELEKLDTTEDEAETFQALAGSMLYGDPSLRAAQTSIAASYAPISALLPYGISGDRPYAVLHAERAGWTQVLPGLSKAHRYWQAQAIPIDLVVIAGDPSALPPGPYKSVPFAAVPSEILDAIDAHAALVADRGHFGRGSREIL